VHSRPDVALFALLPQYLRTRDAVEGRALEALMGVLAGELGTVERDLDQLYDNWFIESCEPWVIPYIGALIGARPMRPFGGNEVGLRSYIANVLGYRQAKGTAAALEQIARDVTGWPVVAVEFFQRLACTQNVNHVRPSAPGTVSIRDAENVRLAGGAFGVGGFSPGVGQASDARGRYAISNLGLFVWRLDSQPLGPLWSEPTGYLGGPVPRKSSIAPEFRFFDPLGADRALFNRLKADRTIAGRVDARTVPAPLDRRLLHRDLDGSRKGMPSYWFDDMPVIRLRLDDTDVPSERLHSCNLETRDDGFGNDTWRRPTTAGHILFDPELGRIALHASDAGKRLEASCAFASPFAIGGGPYDRTASFAAWRAQFFVEDAPPPWVIGVSKRVEEQTGDALQGGVVVASLAAAIELWQQHAVAGARGIILLLDNASYDEDMAGIAQLVRIPAGGRLAIAAADWPRLKLPGGGVGRDLAGIAPLYRRPHIQTNLRVRAVPPNAGEELGMLVLDGLLIEGEVLLLAGALGTLSLRHCTIGASASGLTKGVRVASQNGELAVAIDHCITGPLALAQAGGGLTITDSIVGEDRTLEADPDKLTRVIDAPSADAAIARSTIFGRSRVRSIEAENSIFMGTARAEQRQQGCVRFSYAPLTSRVPRRYRCQPDRALTAAEHAAGGALPDAERARIARAVVPIFTDAAFPSSAFGQLALCGPTEIASGGFGGKEMGAGFASDEPARRANLNDMLDEFLPFGLTAAPLFQT
jgi:hypothetical protein